MVPMHVERRIYPLPAPIFCGSLSARKRLVPAVYEALLHVCDARHIVCKDCPRVASFYANHDSVRLGWPCSYRKGGGGLQRGGWICTRVHSLDKS